MERTITINGKAIRNDLVDTTSLDRLRKDRRNHVQTWREIYQEVRRQWVEAEQGRVRGSER